MKTSYQKIKENRLSGKWIHLSKIEPLLTKHQSNFDISKIGKSFLSKPIYEINLGSGPIKILIWTQMHGNEPTATKVVFDLLNLFSDKKSPDKYLNILKSCTIKIIPMLNPDGALAYTRVNGQGIDLNRDATTLVAPESILLREVLTEFNPDYCFNLHDQRNLYSVGQTKEPASLSFLSPSTEVSRKLTKERIEAMSVISSMYLGLKDDLPNNLSRYNDEFYPKATGDNFQKDGYTTILIEAGHIKDDYDREKVRYYYYKALLIGLLHISKQASTNYDSYNKIPENDTCYLDIIVNNVFLKTDGIYKNIDVGILFVERIQDEKVFREPTITQHGDLSNYGANKYIDANSLKIDNINKVLSILPNLC